MRVSDVPDTDDLPPPPYAPHDPARGTIAAVDPAQMHPVRESLRGGYLRRSPPSAISEGASVPSAMTFLEDRQPSIPNSAVHLDVVEHHLIFAPDTARDDIPFPLPLETYIARDVKLTDWSTFLNYLFPVPGKTATEKQNNEKGAKSRKYVEEDCPERRQRIQSVVDEWNERFFMPRMIHINAKFVPASSRFIPSLASDLSTTSINTPNAYGSATLQRSHSSSSDSSSFSSVDSIKSKDLEGADISQLRSALVAFRLDLTKGNPFRHSVRQLRDEFRFQRRDLSCRERKELKKEYKEQRKELKREVKAVIKEVKNSRKADRKLRKAERKSRREGKRAEIGGADRISHAQEKAQRKRASKQAMRCREQDTGCHDRAADARVGAWDVKSSRS